MGKLWHLAGTCGLFGCNMKSETFTLSIEEAAKITGYSSYMMRRFAREGAFCACMPRGRKGGWEIVRPSLEQWWRDKRASSAKRNNGHAKE
jgi:hypothetical protein